MKKLLLFTFFCTFSIYGFNQVKIGYVDFDMILTAHPKQESVNKSIDQLGQKLSGQFKTKQDYLEGKYNHFLERKEAGASESELKELETELLKLDGEIQLFAKEAEAELETTRKRLLGELLSEIDESLKAIAKKHKADCIMNSTNNSGVSTILHAPLSTDLTIEVINTIGGEVSSSSKALPFDINPAEATIGYTNVELVLSTMREAQNIEGAVQTYKESLADELDKKYEYVMLQYQKWEKMSKDPNASSAELEKLQDALIKYDAQMTKDKEENEQKVLLRREELMAPVLQKLQDAIDKVANDNGYTYILNQTNSSGVSTILFGDDKSDITAHILKELNQTPPQGVSKLNVKKNLSVGYMNAEYILQQLPETESIDKQMDITRKELEAELQKMYENGMDPEQLQKEYNKMEYDLLEKQNNLLQPVMERMQASIDELAKKHKYDYILNRTTGSNILYSNPAQDLDSQMIESLK